MAEKKIWILAGEASGDLYGAPLTVGFISRQRSEIKFSSPEALVAEITRNADTAVEDFRENVFFL